MEDTTQRLQEAIAAARSGRLAEARDIAEELTGSDPQNAHAWFLRGILSEDEGQQRAYLSRTLELDPEHKAARKRMEQMGPAGEADEAGEAEPEAAPEPDEDATMVTESATFMAAAAAADAVDEAEVLATTPPAETVEEAGEAAEEAVDEAEETAEETFEEIFEETPEETSEETFDDTMIAQSPFAEEMAAEDLEVEALFGETPAEDEAEDVDEGLVTVFGAAAAMDEDQVPDDVEAAQEAEEAIDELDKLEASDLAEAVADATVLDEAGEAWFEEEAGEDLWAKVEAEAVPDWLIEDTTAEAEATLTEESVEETFPAAEADVTREQELPDWLLEEPDEDWSEEFEETEIYDEAPATVVTAAVAADEPFEEEAPAPFEEAAPAPAQPKKKSSDRGLEILLILLVIVAVLLVVAIAYFLVNPPSF
ncbi:MAG: hypothetical protein PVJ75_06815 [Chloroflexota bacterium]|jgi:hypothetical protein